LDAAGALWVVEPLDPLRPLAAAPPLRGRNLTERIGRFGLTDLSGDAQTDLVGPWPEAAEFHLDDWYLLDVDTG